MTLSPDSPMPAAYGFRMPAEWEPHEATWLSWPHREETWPGNFEPVPDVFVQLAAILAESETVRINVRDEEMAEDVAGRLKRAGVSPDRVRFHHHPTDDAWVRDHGPCYIVRDMEGRRERAIVNWGYNSWGNKYPPFDQDNMIPSRIAHEAAELCFTPNMVLEGGSIDVNGRGTLLTTESCLFHPNRNPERSREEIEQALRRYLGVTNILWLGDGIVGDDTDGHVDDITRFVAADTIVTVVEEDPQDENYQPLQENLRRLESMTDQQGRAFKIVNLPMPRPVYFDGERLPASYANFYIANRRVIVPVYGQKSDRTALETLQGLFPDRLVIGIDCTALVWGLGAIHCVTQQQPAC
ncbi:Putative agmatine deiminase [Maioricimonas rarisocia]|uniref:Agmatine deiminase n=1 Tax=Maioricimonas rarisocia TaxID=2528026 RepID=A0A517Z3P6_9PLAN|nr:agmatine deiminase family protein [Maioricimonas rarisocia]QDU37119.1 Putative agmatine deiminase [Maioricimonas rarisocia]